MRQRGPRAYANDEPSLPGPPKSRGPRTEFVTTSGATSPAGDVRAQLEQMFALLYARYGPQRWWPAESPTEVVIGAILTQNTAWRNVERAIAALKSLGLIDWIRLRELPENQLAEIVRPAGTFRVKAGRLKSFVEVLFRDYNGRLESLCGGDLQVARARLLAIPGIGPETADAILLYAANRPTFVVDAYTRRVLRRHMLIDGAASYDATQEIFHQSLPRDVRMFNEYHALLVQVAKEHCRSRPACEGCPLVALPHQEHD